MTSSCHMACACPFTGWPYCPVFLPRCLPQAPSIPLRKGHGCLSTTLGQQGRAQPPSLWEMAKWHLLGEAG